MKNFILMTALFIMFGLSFNAQAGTPITDEMAQKYFENCVALTKKEGTMTPDNQNRYCACTAINMQKSMTQENLSALSGRGDTQRVALNILLLDVNGPCMQYTTHDLINKKCMQDLGKQDVCSCLSNKMGNFMKDISKRMLPTLLANDPNIFDPLTPIMESPEFVETQQRIALSCATNPHQN